MLRTTITIILGTALINAATARGDDAEILWQIGQTDHDCRDLKHIGDPTAYEQSFPKDIDFVVGTSDPQTDFSSLHPGPNDAWAGRRAHPFRISFDLADAPAGTYELRVDLVDTHAQQPPIFAVELNGEKAELRLQPGTGDTALLHPEKGKPASVRFIFGAGTLRQGTNRLQLEARRESWLVYDAVSLRKVAGDAEPPVEVAARPSVFFVERAGRLQQEWTLTASGILPGERVFVTVRAGADVVGRAEFPKASLGCVEGIVPVDDTASARELQFTVTAGTQKGAATVGQEPQRKWRIYVAPSTHTDIGYTDIQDKVIALHNRNTDLAVELCREFPLYHWNLESSWAAQMWLQARPAYRHAELYGAAGQRRIGIESGYLNMLTGLCSGEELIRNLSYSARLHRKYGVPFESFTLTDAPSHVWTVPSILAGAGIRCISCGINGVRAPILKNGSLHDRSPFWWEGPDGQRVLAWFTPGYSQAGQIGLRDGIDRMRSAVESHLYRWQHRDDYPCDAILLHGAYSDNVAIGRQIAQSITDYAERYAYPKVILSANNDFFEYIDKNFADELPTFRGCGGSWWEDGAGSSALETGICRVAHQDVIAAETAWAAAVGVAPADDFPQAGFDTVWDNILLYDEHTWGAHNSLTEPTSDFVQRQWAVKAAYATDAARDTDRLLRDGMLRLASRIDSPAGSLVVFNPSGRPRTGVVEAQIPKGAVIVGDDGVVPQQTVHQEELLDRTVAFLAEDVPAVGYRTYRVRPEAGDAAASPKRFDGEVLENDHYRVTFDRKSGAVASILDKGRDAELVDASSTYKLGQTIYADSGEFKDHYWLWGPDREQVKYHATTDGEIRPAASGPVFSSVKAGAKLERFKTVELETILYEHEPRIDFVARLNKAMTYDREAVYIAFPFAGANPRFRYEIGGGSVRPNEDHLPGGCRDWFSVQRWVTVHTDDAAVAWTPVDTPLITLCDMTPGLWIEDDLPMTNGTVFAYVMNNYWFTNYKAGQDGWFTFRFSLTSDSQIDPAAACRFGESAVQPMRAVRLPGGRSQPDLPPTASLCRIEPANVAVTALKRADDGDGLIVRVRETAGTATDVTLHAGFAGVTRANRCDLVERVQDALPLEAGRVRFKIGANAMATVRLR